jgi:hypothetical protein
MDVFVVLLQDLVKSVVGGAHNAALEWAAGQPSL